MLAVDDNPSYLYLLPFVCKSWSIQGWIPYIVFNNVNSEQSELIIRTLLDLDVKFDFKHINKVSTTQNKALYTQCERMYMAKDYPDDDYCIMSDADMFIASDFLNRDYDKVNSFGYDLTGFSQIPMCYVGMPVKKWKELFAPFNVDADLETFARKEAGDWYIAWGCDQDILTGKLRTLQGFHSVNFIHRGTDPGNSGLPLGRWDRYNWIKPKVQIHDCHLSGEAWGDAGTDRLVDMCTSIYPEVDWKWIDNYKLSFKKIFNL